MGLREADTSSSPKPHLRQSRERTRQPHPNTREEPHAAASRPAWGLSGSFSGGSFGCEVWRRAGGRREAVWASTGWGAWWGPPGRGGRTGVKKRQKGKLDGWKRPLCSGMKRSERDRRGQGPVGHEPMSCAPVPAPSRTCTPAGHETGDLGSPAGRGTGHPGHLQVWDPGQRHRPEANRTAAPSPWQASPPLP